MKVFNRKPLVEESSTAMDDMAVSVQRIAESASSVTELAVATSEQANDGSSVIQNPFHK